MTNPRPAPVLTRVGLVGGGRWARVLLTVLRDVVPASIEIVWVSSHGFQANQAWLHNASLANVRLTADEDALWHPAVGALLVATASATHARYVEKALQAGIPVLSEKPYAYTAEEASHLISQAEAANVPAGVNLEFTYASYLNDLLQSLKDTPLHSLHLTWEDPWCEERHGERKYADATTPIVHDMLPHAWSIAHRLTGDVPWKIFSVTRTMEGALAIESQAGNIAVTFHLNRRGQTRTRHLSINAGTTLLDFSTEPGTLTVGGTSTTNTWHGPRPLGASLSAFWQQVTGTATSPWPTSLKACLESVKFAEAAMHLLQDQYTKAEVQLRAENRFTSSDAHTICLLVDREAPRLAAQDKRPAVATADEQRTFAAKLLAS